MAIVGLFRLFSPPNARITLRSRQQTGAECYRTSADDRNTTGSTGSEYSTSQVTGSTFLSSRGFCIVDLRVPTAVLVCGFRQTGSGSLDQK